MKSDKTVGICHTYEEFRSVFFTFFIFQMHIDATSCDMSQMVHVIAVTSCDVSCVVHVIIDTSCDVSYVVHVIIDTSCDMS